MLTVPIRRLSSATAVVSALVLAFAVAPASTAGTPSNPIEPMVLSGSFGALSQISELNPPPVTL